MAVIPAQKLISIDDASISTLSVEIKTVSIGRKQMSMALFRQLPKKNIIDMSDPELRLNGMPWGLINYHWDGCDYVRGESANPYDSEHVHVLWQHGKTILQSPTMKDPGLRKLGNETKARSASTLSAVTKIGMLIRYRDTHDSPKWQDNTIRFGGWFLDDRAGDFLYHIQYRPEPLDVTSTNRKIESIAEDLDVEIPANESACFELYERTKAEFSRTIRSIGNKMTIYKQRYDELLSLEQLYIGA